MASSAAPTTPRLLITCPYYVPGQSGAARHMLELAKRSASEGWQVTVYTTDALDFDYFWDRRARKTKTGTEREGSLVIRRFAVRHLPLGKYGYFGWRKLMSLLARLPFDTTGLLLRMCLFTPLAPSLYRELNGDGDYDLVHAYTLPFDSLAYAAQRYAQRCACPFVFTPLTHLGENAKSAVREHYTLPHQIEMSKRSNRVLAQTSIERDYLIGRGVPAAKIVVVGPGVDPKSITGGHGDSFRQRHGLDGPVVFYIGVHAYDKGTVHLIEAMRLLWERGSSTNLVLAGAHFPGFGKYLDSLPQETRDRCLLLGRVDEEEKRDLLAAGDVFVMPSRTDSFGIVYLEAWLYKKPVIGALAGGVPDVITHGEDGLLVPFGNVAELAEAIERLLEERDLARRLGQAGYEKTLARHTWDHKYAQVKEVYEELTR